MKAQKLIYGGLFVCASLIASNYSAMAAGSEIGGKLDVILSGSAAKIEAEGGKIHLGSVNLQETKIGGNATIITDGKVTGTVKAAKDAEVNVASLSMENSKVMGNLFVEKLYGSAASITAENGAEVHLGSAKITDSQFSGNLDIKTDGRVNGAITAKKEAEVHIASLSADKVKVSGGNASFDLGTTVEKVDADPSSYVYLSTAQLSDVTFNNGVTIKTRSTLGQVKAEKDATVSIASAHLTNATFNGKVDLDLSASVPGGITAKQGSTVEIGGFAMR